METASPRSFYPKNPLAPLHSRVHLAFTQLEADLVHPVHGPAILNGPKANVTGDFVDDLIADNQAIWNSLLGNAFCSGMAKNTLADGDRHFKWYMVQDMIYLRNYVYWELGFFGKAPWADIQARSAGTRIQKDIGNVDFQIDTCVNIGVPRETVLNAVASDIIKKYNDYLIAATRDVREDWFSLHIIILPCILSYGIMAANLNQDPTTKKGTVFDLNWIQPNLQVSSLVAIYKKFLNDNVPKHDPKERAHWNELFTKSCHMELDFWTASLTGVL